MAKKKKQVVRQAYSDKQKRDINWLLGNNLREARKNAGMSQTDVYNAIGLTKNRLSEIENGHVTIDIYLFLMLLDLYGQSSDYILGRSCEPINDVLASSVNSVRLNTYKYIEPLIAAMTECTISQLQKIDPDNHQALLTVCEKIAPVMIQNGVALYEAFPKVYEILSEVAKLRRNIGINEAKRQQQMHAQLDAINQRHDKEDGHMLLDDLTVMHQYTLPLPKAENIIVEIEVDCE